MEVRGCADQLLGDLPKSRVGFLFARVRGDAEEASQDANDIAVENRAWLIESDAGNRPGGVAPDAGQRENIVKVFGEVAVVPCDDLLRGSLKIADPRVITEAFPEFVELGR